MYNENMMLDIQKPVNKSYMFWVRVDKPLYDKVQILVKQHKVDRSVVVRKLIEIALETLKDNKI